MHAYKIAVMFKNLPPAPHMLLEKSVCPPRGVDSLQICKDPVQQSAPHQKVFDMTWGVDS